MDVFKAIITDPAKDDLLKMPLHIIRKLQGWIDNIEKSGLNEVRKIPGYHDEPLKGKRVGQRSIRLSRAYRAIYVMGREGKIEVVKVLEVSKHEY